MTHAQLRFGVVGGLHSPGDRIEPAKLCHLHRTHKAARDCSERRTWYNEHDLVVIQPNGTVIDSASRHVSASRTKD